MRSRRTLTLPAFIALTALLVGCSSNNSQTGPASQSEQSAAQQRARPTRRSQSRTERPAPRVATVTVPAGTSLEVRLSQEISSGSAESGTGFQGTLAAPLIANGVEIAPVGSTVTGTVVKAVSSGRLSRPAELSLALTSVTPKGGEPIQISTRTLAMKRGSHKKRDIEIIGGGGGIGALIGGIAGGKKGAAIGAAIGAAGGTGAAAATGKKEIVLPPETKLDFRLSAPITLRKGA